MINAETKDYILAYILSKGLKMKNANYSDIPQDMMDRHEFNEILLYFGEKGLLKNLAPTETGDVLLVKPTMEALDFQNAGGFTRREKLDGYQVEKLCGELIKLERENGSSLPSIAPVISSLTGILSLFKS